ncbi:hypothetical protein D3C76_1836280 [compost metagenome]
MQDAEVITVPILAGNGLAKGGAQRADLAAVVVCPIEPVMQARVAEEVLRILQGTIAVTVD